jgi:hypothetical protein
MIYTFNATKACEIIASRIPPGNTDCGEIPPFALERFRYTNSFVEEHLPHVNPDEPGIVACVVEGNEYKLFLIDGNHRTERAVREGKTPKFFMLTPKETEQCFLGKRPAPGSSR